MDIWIYGYMDIWIYGYVDMWICGYMIFNYYIFKLCILFNFCF